MFTISIILSAYSVVSALVLAVSHFRAANYPDRPGARYAGVVFVLTLGSLQLCHFLYLYAHIDCIHDWYYRVLLFTAAPVFYLFSKPLLTGQGYGGVQMIAHALPVIVAPILPMYIAMPASFAIGSVYLMWLAKSLYALRAQRSHFHIEIFILAAAFFIAVLVVMLGLGKPVLDEQWFYVYYAGATGCAFILINLAFSLMPRLPVAVAEAASESYATTTLARVDCDAAIEKLERLMQQDRIYANPDIDLPTLAGYLDLNSHQLSELINTRLGKGFSRYLREQRVAAASTMLLSQPATSVLAVGLNVGFSSQSNFYDAFREITGMTPGKYRKITPRPVAE